jgi:putative Holliday junction resolvase
MARTHHLFSSQPHPTAEPSRRILALDYGRRRIGIAISDELGLTAQPLETLVRTNRRAYLRRLRELVRKHGVKRVLIGYPLHLDGVAGEMAAEAVRFAARIAKELKLPVELMDERLTSWEAGQIVSETKPVSRRRGATDDVAAAVLLREYLDRENNSKAMRGNDKS